MIIAQVVYLRYVKFYVCLLHFKKIFEKSKFGRLPPGRAHRLQEDGAAGCTGE